MRFLYDLKHENARENRLVSFTTVLFNFLNFRSTFLIPQREFICLCSTFLNILVDFCHSKWIVLKFKSQDLPANATYIFPCVKNTSSIKHTRGTKPGEPNLPKRVIGFQVGLVRLIWKCLPNVNLCYILYLTFESTRIFLSPRYQNLDPGWKNAKTKWWYLLLSQCSLLKKK